MDGRAAPLMDRQNLGVVGLPIFLSIHICVYLCTYLSIYGSICLSIYLSICLSIIHYLLIIYCRVSIIYSLSICQSASLKRKEFCKTSSILERDNTKNATIPRVPQFSKLTISKAKQFCETSLKNGELNAELTALYQCVWRFDLSTPSVLSILACHEKVKPEVLHLSCKITLASKPEDLMLQNATLLRKAAPKPPNTPDSCVSCTVLATQNASWQVLFKCPPPAAFEAATNPRVLFTLGEVQYPLRLPRKNRILTSKSGPSMWCS